MRKKLAMLMASLFLVMGTAWAQVAYTVDATTGSGVTSNGWSKNWSYTTTAEKPAALKLLCNAANMQTRDNLLALYVGTTSPATYTLQVPNKYHIASYSFDFVKDGEYTNDVTLTVNGNDYKPTNETQTVSVENVNASLTSFVFSGANKGIKVSNFVVNIVVAPIELTTDEKNPKWYTIKNVRGNAYARYDGDGEAIKLYGDIVDRAFLFYFTAGTTEGTYKIHNAANDLLCTGTNSWTETGAEWYIKTSGNTSYPGFAISTNADLTQNAAWNDFQGSHTSVAVYNGNDAGSTWDIVRYEGEAPAIQLSTEGNIVLHYIRSIRRDSYVNFAGHNSTFKEGAQGLASYWYFVQDTEAQKNAPEGFIACKIFNAAHATGVENHSSGFMGTDSWPARTYYIGTSEHNRYGYLIYRSDANLEDNGYGCWHDSQGNNIMDYHKNDDGSLWRIYPAGKTGAELMSEATTAQNNALSSIALYEAADYYTYPAEAIATAKTAIEAINTAELHSAVAGITSIPAAMTTMQATDKGTAGPAAGDYIQLSNRNFGDYLSAVDNDDNKIRKMSDKTNLATLWKVEAGSADGSVKLKNVGNGKYMGAIAQNADVQQVEAASAADLTFSNVTDVYAAFQTTGGNNYSFANYNSNWGGRILGWEKNDAASQWVMTQAYPLTVVYQFEGAELTDLRVEKVVEPGTVYTIENSDAFDGKTIKTVVGATDNGDGTWAVTVNAATTVTVTLGYEDTNLYALKSPTGTYFNFTPITTQGTTTQASFQDEPSFLYKKSDESGVYFQSFEDDNKYIGYQTTGNFWLTTTAKSYWIITEADGGLVSITRIQPVVENGVTVNKTVCLGHDTKWSAGIGIFTNVGDNCNKWQLIPAYPITIIYKNSNDEVLETINAATIAGTGYSFTVDTQGGTLVSCVADKGTMTETDGTYSFAAVNGATTVTVTLEDIEVPEAEPTNLYALKSPTGTYFSFTEVVPEPGAAMTYASFQDEPSFLYKVAENNSYYFESMSTPGEYIGVGPSNAYWIVAKDNKALWNISAEDADGYVTISRSTDDNARLGHDGNTNKGTGIFSNVGNTCFGWELIPAYPVTIIYKNNNGDVTETVKAGVCVGESYTIDTKGQIIASYETDKGEVEVTDGVYTIPAVYGATTVTISIAPMGAVENPAAVVALVNRIGGTGTSNNFKFVHDPALNVDGETFEIGAEDGKILIKGSTLSALTTGLGWYLNNIAHINIAWNSLNEKTTTVRWDENAGYADLSYLPIPTETETHTSDAKYRYYLNYCTFGYSMTSWTWTRWQQEIDWMALHGINMPLQIVGLEEVWRKFLTMKDANGNSKYGYSESDAMAFVAGPAFTAWWGMNNLEGWGGTGNNGWGGVQDPAWYERQANLAKQITDLQRSLGMQPVLPGFSGMVPSNFATKTGTGTVGQSIPTDKNGGSWGGFTRPNIIDPDYANFAAVAADYYACLKEVMGESQYYSMDPFHEDGVLSSNGTEERYAKGYKNIFDAMEVAKSGSQWVIQQWQWKWYQKVSITAVPAGRLIALDLFSDGKPAFDSYDGYAPQDAVFCAIPNFGGRSGLMGRLQNVTDNYFSYKAKYASIKGIGTAPEAIEQTPVAYDLIYQLPWMNGVKPDVAAWVDNYAVARYGKDNAVVKEAWSLLRQGPLNYGADAIQGPVEDVWAARPNLDATPASSWGTTLNGAGNTYTPARRQMLIDAVYKLIDQEDELELTNGSVYKSNYLYDLVEFGGAVMADYAYDLLKGIKEAKDAAGANFANDATYKARRDAFLQLILDMDAFRGTNLNFRLGKWTQEARDAAVEAQKYGATTANEDWYEFNNARTILTTWGDQGQNGNGAWNNGLKDYSYRSWQGLLADYYYPRWKYYFDNGCTHPNGNAKNYFYFEWNWAHGMTHAVGDTQKSTTRLAEGAKGYSYSREPENTNTVEKAVEMLGKYIIPVAMADGTHYAYRYLTNDLSSKVTIIAMGGTTIDLTKYFGALEGATVTGEFIDGEVTDLANIAVKSDLTKEAYTGTITLADGTVLTFGVSANPKYYGAYRIKYNGEPVFIQYNEGGDNSGSVGYKVMGATGYGENGNAVSTGLTADYEADKIFTIAPSGLGYTLSAQGQYLKTTASSGWAHIMFSDQKGDAGTYTFTEAEGLVKLKSTNTQGMASVAIFGNGAWGNDVDGKARQFAIEKVENYAIIIPESGYLAVCLPFNVVLPVGMTAYDVTVAGLTSGDDGAITTLQAIATESQILKAGTPALLKAAANIYNLTITMENNEAKTSSHESKLRGNFVKQTLQPGTNGLSKFVLDAATGKFELLDAEQEIPANTCWIEAKIDAEHVEVTEHKGKIVKVDDWLFEYDDATNGIKLKDVAATGDGNLEIKETFTINGKTQKVVAITPDFLEGNEQVTEITLPSSLVNLGFRKVIPMFETSYEGEKGDTAIYKGETTEVVSSQGMNRCLEFPNDPDTGKPFKVSKDFAWKLTLDVTIDRDSLSYNQWGSSIVSTDENSLADSYFGCMQIYMWKDLQHIVVKIDNADDRYSYSTPAFDENGNETGELLVNRHFTFELEHDGSGGYQVVIYYDNGKAKMYNITASENNKVGDFDRLYYSLPEGIHVNVKFDKLTNEGLFVGCTNLKAIHVHPDNPTFSSCEHGVLYDKNKYYVMRIPEGKTSHHFEIPSKVVKLYPGSIHGVSADIVLHSNPEIGVVSGHEHAVENAKFFLSLDDKDNTITEKETGYGGARDFTSANNNTYQSGRYKRAPLEAGKYGTIVLPFAPTNWKKKYDFFKMTDADATSFHFSQVDELQPNTAYLYKLKENPGIMDMEGDTLDVFETEEVFTVQTHAKYNPNDETPGGFRALGAYVNYYIDTKNYPNTNYYTFSVSRQEFNRITKKLNYRPYRALFVVTPEQPGQAAQAPAKLSLRITRNDGSTTEIDPSQVEGMETPIYYDLQGRRVENPTSGVYIVNGKKVVIR